jgi:CheY-like chemotaxis protein
MSRLLEVSISGKASLKYAFGENIPAIEADPSQMHQAIMNLVINASESLGEEGGTITVATGAMQCDEAYLSTTYLGAESQPGNCVFVEVSDTGCGMDEETLEKMFDPFFSTKFAGRGLGLAAVLGIVRGHHGSIEVHSEREKGTTFRLLFPCSEKPLPPKNDTEAEVAQWRGGGTVLLVDDEAAVLRIGSRMLETLGFDVLTAVDGIEAVALYREHKDEISLVILDVTMPRMGGEEAFEEIRKINDNAVIILSSGYDERDAVNRFATRGLAGFIHKPYEFETLKRMVSRALAG